MPPRVAEYMRGRAPESANEIAAALGMNADTLRRNLRTYEAQGKVQSRAVSCGPALWSLTDDVVSIPAAEPAPPRILSSRVDLAAELFELEKRIAADTARRAEIVESLR